MSKNTLLIMGMAFACAHSPYAMATDEAVLKELRSQLDALRTDYEQRIRELEERLARAEAEARAARQAAETARSTAQQAESKALAASTRAEQAKLAASDARDTAEALEESVEEAETAPGGTVAKTANAFNPAISLVLQGRATTYDNDPDEWHLQGFQLGGESGLSPRGLSLGETELTFSANADDWFYGQATLSVKDDGDETEVGFEEAYADTLSLPYGLGLRFGRFYSDIAFQNTVHSHAWDFADSPLVYQAFLGSQYSDDGVRLSWLAPTDLFLELGGEALRGDPYPGGDAENSNELYGGAHTVFVHLGGDIGSDHSWKLGLAQFYVEPNDRESGHLQSPDTRLHFDGESRLTTASLLYKWASEGNARNANFSLEAEYFQRHEEGIQRFEQDGSSALIDYRGPQRGYYLQGVYQFRPEWRVGLRYDRLWSDNRFKVIDNPDGLDPRQILHDSGLENGHDPYRLSAMLDFSRSEFSRLRLQYEYDQSTSKGDNLWMLQYIYSLGSHGAHQY